MSSQEQNPTFEQLWSRIARHVRAAVARHRSRDMALAADDLLQEVRIRVWETCQRDNNSSFNTSYYMRVVNSAIIDSLRKHRGTLAHSVRAYGDEDQDMLAELGADEPGPEQLLDHALQGARLRAALQRLPKARAQAVALYLQGYNAEEIAGLMKCDRHRAHNLAYRGVRELKQLLLAEVDASEVDQQQNVRDERQ